MVEPVATQVVQAYNHAVVKLLNCAELCPPCSIDVLSIFRGYVQKVETHQNRVVAETRKDMELFTKIPPG